MRGHGGDRGPDPVIRPFILTGGRTASTLPVEALCVASSRALTTAVPLTDVEREIVRLCAEPLSVAEISAKTRLPLGVCRVIVADLADHEHVFVSQQTSVDADLDLIGRLLDGIRNA